MSDKAYSTDSDCFSAFVIGAICILPVIRSNKSGLLQKTSSYLRLCSTLLLAPCCSLCTFKGVNQYGALSCQSLPTWLYGNIGGIRDSVHTFSFGKQSHSLPLKREPALLIRVANNSVEESAGKRAVSRYSVTAQGLLSAAHSAERAMLL